MKHLKPQGFSPGAIMGAGETESCPQRAYSPVLTELGLELRISDTFSSSTSHFLNLISLLMKKKIFNFTKISKYVIKKSLITKQLFLTPSIQHEKSVPKFWRSITWSL